MNSLWSTVLMLFLAVGYSESARILAIFPMPGKSHWISFSALLKELAARGHQVTVISGFPLDPPLANYTDIPVYSTFPEGVIPTNTFDLRDEASPFLMPVLLSYMGQSLCERALQHPNVQKLIEDDTSQFDLVILEAFLAECFYGLIHKYQAPFFHISSNTIAVWMGDGMGNPHTTSYIPEVVLPFRPQMTFTQRLENTVLVLYMYLSRQLYYLPKQDQIMRKYFKDPNIPPIWEMERNSSLLLLNAHFSLNFPRPFTPNTIEVGGMHIKPGKKLPKDLQKFMDEATDGVIYFSLGSFVQSADMPVALRQSFVDAFSRLKQKVLWKWEADSVAGLSKNVRIGKWMPQNDILAHPNLRVFITHGGLLSTQEATYHGVPLLSIPFQADQKTNALSVQNKGYAIVLELENITVDSLSWALNELTSNPRYRDNAKRLSTLFRDQPESPLQKAVYWTEYVIRHKGARHLRSAALDLWWFQYYLLDVLALLLGVVISGAFILFLTCRTVYRLLVSKKPAKKLVKHSKAKKRN